MKLIATLIDQSAWIFSYSDEAEEEEAAQEEEEEEQPLESPGDQPEGGPEVFHEAETSIYEIAPQDPGGEDGRTVNANPHRLGPINHAGATLLTV